MTQIGLADKRSAVQGRSPLGGPEGARFRFPGGDWQTVPGFPNDNIANPEGSGDWTTCGFLTTLWRSGGVKFSGLTPERVASALSEGQRYASRNCSYFTTCCDELLDELGVRGIVEKPLETRGSPATDAAAQNVV